MKAGAPRFVTLGLSVEIHCDDPATCSLLAAHYRHLSGPSHRHVEYCVSRSKERTSFSLTRVGGDTVKVRDAADLLYRLDRDLTVRVQEARPDLYFLHAAALEWRGQTILLVAPSGVGKSTTTWALSHHGFRYLSDELAPVDLATLHVHPYPRTLSLKTTPPAPYHDPSTASRVSVGMRVSPLNLPGGIAKGVCRLATVFFLQRGRRGASSIRPVGRAEAIARLYANTLNALAHPGDGFDGADRIVSQTKVLELRTGHLTDSCRLIEAVLSGHDRG